MSGNPFDWNQELRGTVTYRYRVTGRVHIIPDADLSVAIDVDMNSDNISCSMFQWRCRDGKLQWDWSLVADFNIPQNRLGHHVRGGVSEADVLKPHINGGADEWFKVRTENNGSGYEMHAPPM
jgi:hypothetical protein